MKNNIVRLDVFRRYNVRYFISKKAIYIILVLVFIISTILSPVFMTHRNLVNVIRQASILGIVASGQTLVILTGGIDLSVASVMAFMSILSANMMAGNNELVISITVVCLGIAIIIGVLNGLLITKLNIPPFIATLGMLLIIQGIRFIYCGGMPKGSIPDNMRFLGRGIFLGVPIPTWFVLFIGLVCWIILEKTVFGRSIYAVGGNQKTAFLSGIKVNLVKIGSYVLSSLMAGFAGLLLTGWIGLADNWLGQGYELDSIAAVVIGGSILTGGKGTVWGSLAGSMLLAVLYNLIVLLGLDVEIQRIVKGLVIMGAVAIYKGLESAS